MKAKTWYIKERHNPQFKKPYYTALGNITKKDAEKHTKSLYGYNFLIRFDNEKDYNKKLQELGLIK